MKKKLFTFLSLLLLGANCMFGQVYRFIYYNPEEDGNETDIPIYCDYEGEEISSLYVDESHEQAMSDWWVGLREIYPNVTGHFVSTNGLYLDKIEYFLDMCVLPNCGYFDSQSGTINYPTMELIDPNHDTYSYNKDNTGFYTYSGNDLSLLATDFTYKRIINEGLNTICLPFSIVPTDFAKYDSNNTNPTVKVYHINKSQGTSVVFSRISDNTTIPPGLPVLIKSDKTFVWEFHPEDQISVTGVSGNDNIFFGTFCPEKVSSSTNYGLAKSSGSSEYDCFANFEISQYASIYPFRAYLAFDQLAKANFNIVLKDTETTGIADLNADATQKQNNVTYTLDGKQISGSNFPGLKIINGKKFINK